MRSLIEQRDGRKWGAFEHFDIVEPFLYDAPNCDAFVTFVKKDNRTDRILLDCAPL